MRPEAFLAASAFSRNECDDEAKPKAASGDDLIDSQNRPVFKFLRFYMRADIFLPFLLGLRSALGFHHIGRGKNFGLGGG